MPKAEEWQMLPEMGHWEEKMLEAFQEEHTAFRNLPPAERYNVLHLL
jgi:hypothetical protein